MKAEKRAVKREETKAGLKADKTAVERVAS